MYVPLKATARGSRPENESEARAVLPQTPTQSIIRTFLVIFRRAADTF